MKRIYLCSRVSADARPLNDSVRIALEAKELSVFTPHLAPMNNSTGATDAEIYTQDVNQLLEADIIVAVGRLGRDCSWELGYAQAIGKPIFWYAPQGTDLGWSPMLHKVQSNSLYSDLAELVSDVAIYAKVAAKVGKI